MNRRLVGLIFKIYVLTKFNSFSKFYFKKGHASYQNFESLQFWSSEKEKELPLSSYGWNSVSFLGNVLIAQQKICLSLNKQNK